MAGRSVAVVAAKALVAAILAATASFAVSSAASAAAAAFPKLVSKPVTGIQSVDGCLTVHLCVVGGFDSGT